MTEIYLIQYRRDDGSVGALRLPAESRKVALREFRRAQPQGHVLAALAVAFEGGDLR